MGSTGTTRPKGLTDRQFFEQEFPNMLVKDGTILKCRTLPTSGEWTRVFYAAVKTHSSGEVWALVVLMGRHGGTFYYKEMDEGMGPGEAECPAEILDLLSPTDNQWANEWRERCRKHAVLKAASQIPAGTVVRFDRPFNFGNGKSADRFRYTPEGRRKWWWAVDEQGERRFPCRLGSDWYLHPHKVEGAA